MATKKDDNSLGPEMKNARKQTPGDANAFRKDDLGQNEDGSGVIIVPVFPAPDLHNPYNKPPDNTPLPQGPFDFTPEGNKPGIPNPEPTASASGGEGGGGALPCFVKGTLITTSQGLLPIEQLHIDDEIYAFDAEHKDAVVRKIVKTIEAQVENILVLNFGVETLRCTPLHRFYTGKWTPAEQLKPGDTVSSIDGHYRTLQEVQQETQLQPVFNLIVDELHNYFVGQSGLLVHNDKTLNDPGAIDSNEG